MKACRTHDIFEIRGGTHGHSKDRAHGAPDTPPSGRGGGRPDGAGDRQAGRRYDRNDGRRPGDRLGGAPGPCFAADRRLPRAEVARRRPGRRGGGGRRPGAVDRVDQSGDRAVGRRYRTGLGGLPFGAGVDRSRSPVQTHSLSGIDSGGRDGRACMRRFSRAGGPARMRPSRRYPVSSADDRSDAARFRLGNGSFQAARRRGSIVSTRQSWTTRNRHVNRRNPRQDTPGHVAPRGLRRLDPPLPRRRGCRRRLSAGDGVEGVPQWHGRRDLPLVEPQRPADARGDGAVEPRRHAGSRPDRRRRASAHRGQQTVPGSGPQGAVLPRPASERRHRRTQHLQHGRRHLVRRGGHVDRFQLLYQAGVAGSGLCLDGAVLAGRRVRGLRRDLGLSRPPHRRCAENSQDPGSHPGCHRGVRSVADVATPWSRLPTPPNRLSRSGAIVQFRAEIREPGQPGFQKTDIVIQPRHQVTRVAGVMPAEIFEARELFLADVHQHIGLEALLVGFEQMHKPKLERDDQLVERGARRTDVGRQQFPHFLAAGVGNVEQKSRRRSPLRPRPAPRT